MHVSYISFNSAPRDVLQWHTFKYSDEKMNGKKHGKQKFKGVFQLL